jgi:hypothetical protein
MEAKDLVYQNHSVLNLVYQNQKVLNAMQKLVLQSKSHIEFLASASPEISTNLESIAESMQTLAGLLENQITFNRDTRIKLAKEIACKNQAYDFIAIEKLVSRFKTFCECYPTDLYNRLTGADIPDK